MTVARPHARALAVTHVLRPDRGAFSIERVYADVRAQLPDTVAARAWVCPHPSRGIVARLRGALAARRLPGDLIHVTGDAHYLALFLPRRRTVLTVHDCEFVRRARGLKRALLWLFWLKLPAARARVIIVPSEATRRDLLALVRLDPARLVVIENPVSPGFDPAPATPHAGPTRILQIGTKANKNLERLAAALAGLDVTLFVVGRPTAAQHRALAAAGVRYDWATGLSDAGVRAAYQACDIVTFCSLSEGFGLPIIEAQSVGRAVVTSTRAPMPEVAGAGAAFADPEDVDDIRHAIRGVIENPDRRRHLVRLGRENVGRFHARRIAAAHADLYRRIVGDGAGQGGRR